jgi:hypothetical protein
MPLWAPPGGWWYEIRVEWWSYHGCPPTDLYCDGEVAVEGVLPYEWQSYYDPVSGPSCDGNYRAFDLVQAGYHCYWAFGALNEACLEVP